VKAKDSYLPYFWTRVRFPTYYRLLGGKAQKREVATYYGEVEAKIFVL
jgi:hypothetical protein